MGYIRGRPRDQSLLFAEVLDDYITEDNSVRFRDAFVDDLNLDEVGSQQSELASTGWLPMIQRIWLSSTSMVI